MLSMPEKGQRLRDELKPVMEGYPQKKPSLTELEQLPYLGAVIKESLRYSCCPDPCNRWSTNELRQNGIWVNASTPSHFARHRSPI